jgi:bifunctional oligoribonuclease and PAP phosphatase NrnA
MIDQFKQLLEEAQTIFITSHTSPDPDATSSVLLLGSTLKLNYPDKMVVMALEEEPDGLKFLEGYSGLRFGPLEKVMTDVKPDLIVMVDVGNFNRASRFGSESIASYIKASGAKTATIDHHEPLGHDQVDVYISSTAPAAAQEIYDLCFNQLKLKKPEGHAQTTMLGVYADTGGFVYLAPGQGSTFDLVGQLVKDGANIEFIRNQLNQYSEAQMVVISELAANITHGNDYTYTFLRDEFVDKWLAANSSAASMNRATKTFIDSYIRNVDGRPWGFLAYKDSLESEGVYSVSFRSLRGVKDVATLATSLGGGGHKSASGAKVQAKSVDGAVKIVRDRINQTA